MSEEEEIRKKNTLYLNKLIMKERVERNKSNSSKVKGKSKKQIFGSQVINFNDIVYVIEGYETIMYAFYFVAIPYFVGALCLFIVVAGGNFDNFMLLDINAFFIVWVIGYEIVAVVSLIWITLLYLQYEEPESFY